jgi:hypothetical protein
VGTARPTKAIFLNLSLIGVSPAKFLEIKQKSYFILDTKGLKTSKFGATLEPFR